MSLFDLIIKSNIRLTEPQNGVILTVKKMMPLILFGSDNNLEGGRGDRDSLL